MQRAISMLCPVFMLACGKLLALDDYRYAESTSAEAGDDAEANAADASSAEGSPEVGPSLCKLAAPPPRNISVDTGGTLELTFVLRTIDIGDDSSGSDGGSSGYREIGYDLDGRCTSGGDPPTCVNPFRDGVYEDGQGGIDNATGEMVASIKAVFGRMIISSATVNDEINAGVRAPTAIFRVRGYEGIQDDDHVDVDWYLPVLPGEDESGSADGASPPPKWDGTDVWPIQPPSFVPTLRDGSQGSPAGPAVARTSVDGYVSNYRLIARFPDGIPMRFSYVTAALFDGVLSVDVVPNVMPKPYELRNGLLTGRATRHDIFADIPVMTNLLSGQPICMDNALYAGVRNWLCSFPDLSSKNPAGSPPSPSGSESLPSCDMLSFGLAFQPVLAKVGATVDVPPLPTLCPHETDPANEMCEPAEAGVDP